MKTKLVLFVSFLFGLFAFSTITYIYFHGGGFSGSFSNKNEDWGAFGSYFGGVLGAIFGFFSFILLIATLLQQEKQLGELYDENSKQNHINYMEAINEDIRYLLQRQVRCRDGISVEFGDFVMGSSVDEPNDKRTYKILILKLLKYTAEYANALHLYRDNFDSYFQYRAHRVRVLLFAEFMKLNSSMLEGMEQVTLSVIFLNIGD